MISLRAVFKGVPSLGRKVVQGDGLVAQRLTMLVRGWFRKMRRGNGCESSRDLRGGGGDVELAVDGGGDEGLFVFLKQRNDSS